MVEEREVVRVMEECLIFMSIVLDVRDRCVEYRRCKSVGEGVVD